VPAQIGLWRRSHGQGKENIQRSTLNVQRPMSEGNKAADDFKIDSRVRPNMMGISLEPDIRTARIRDRPTLTTRFFLKKERDFFGAINLNSVERNSDR
jgi:hypothetical protein